MKANPRTINVCPNGSRPAFTFPADNTNKPTKNQETQTWGEIFRSYCNLTSLHGFKYLSEDNRAWFERCYWLIAIIVVYALLSVTMREQINKFVKNPLLTSFEPVQTRVSTIPFPSVTICPDTQIYTSVFNFTDALNNASITGDDLGKMYIALSACQMHGYQRKVNSNFSKKVVREMRDAVVGEENVKRMVYMFAWDNRMHTTLLSKYFQPVNTFHGSCISFNMMPMDQILRYPPEIEDNWAQKYYGSRETIWSPDDGYFKNVGNSFLNSTPPWHLPKSSLNNNWFALLLKLPKEDGVDSSCNRKRGFNGFVHNPAELPGVSHHRFYAPGSRYTTLNINPKIYTIDKSLKGWHPNERGCYFQEEKWLKYFKVYTQRNCETECITNYTLDNCGCFSPLFHPNNADATACDGELMMACLSREENLTENDACNCLPSCSELQYGVTTSIQEWDWSDHDISYKNNNMSVHTAIAMTFEGKYAQGIKRSALFGWMDFIANMGGLLGLFLGFSILSVVELIYHFTLRNYKRFIILNNKKKTPARQHQNSFKRFNRNESLNITQPNANRMFNNNSETLTKLYNTNQDRNKFVALQNYFY